MQEFQDWEICRSILESLPTGLCVVDMQKRVVFWSDGAERITGYRRHEVVGHDCQRSALPYCDKLKGAPCPETCPLDAVIRTVRRVDGMGFFHHKNGHRLHLPLTAAPIHNAHGSIIGAVETFHDHQAPENPEHREETLKLSGCLDEGTGLPNHAMMQSHLRESIATFFELRVPFAVVCLRVDGLDRFRSNFGAEAVAALLRAIAQTIETTLWKTDVVGRWEDDKFLAILNECTEDAVHSVCQRLAQILADEGIEWWGEIRALPISIGQASARSYDNMDSLLQRAQESIGQNSQTAAAGSGQTASGS